MRQKLELGLPDKLALYHRGSTIEIVRTWFGTRVVMATVFAVFWDGFLLVWYVAAIGNKDTIAILFPLLHVVVGVGITYWAAAGWVNRTQIVVGIGKITVRHGPLPWAGNLELQVGNVKQLYSNEKRSQSDGSTSTAYEVHAITQYGRTIKLVRGLETSQQALYIEQEIEKYLGIEDVPVKGEIG